MPAISAAAASPTSVDVKLTTGEGVAIAWADGHRSHYSFQYLRDACPCALCNEERDNQHRKPGDAPAAAPGALPALPMFRAAARPTAAEPVGRYAIRFTWNDGHQHGIYSWSYLREICPCQQCAAMRAAS